LNLLKREGAPNERSVREAIGLEACLERAEMVHQKIEMDSKPAMTLNDLR
jgi:hypothetical protein